MSLPVDLHITRAAGGGLCLRDPLERIVAGIPGPGTDQRMGSPEREDQIRANAALLAQAGQLLEVLRGVRTMIETETTIGALVDRPAWRKAIGIIDGVVQRASTPWSPA